MLIGDFVAIVPLFVQYHILNIFLHILYNLITRSKSVPDQNGL